MTHYTVIAHVAVWPPFFLRHTPASTRVFSLVCPQCATASLLDRDAIRSPTARWFECRDCNAIIEARTHPANLAEQEKS